MRSNRGSTLEHTENEASIEAAPEATPQEATDAASQTEAKRAARPPIDVGDVIVTPSTRTDFSSRPSRITSDPVYLAVQAAEFDQAVDLHVATDKVEAVKKRLRTASDPRHLKVGMTIVPGTPSSDQDESKVVVTFIKRQERATRKSKSEGTSAAE
jgi:hypothetical protein